jgi:hypothetical protein
MVKRLNPWALGRVRGACSIGSGLCAAEYIQALIGRPSRRAALRPLFTGHWHFIGEQGATHLAGVAGFGKKVATGKAAR